MIDLTKQQIEDMRTSLGLGAQPFTKDAIDSLCALAVRGLSTPTEGGATIPVPREDLAAACCAVNRDRWACSREGDAAGEAAMTALHDRLSLLYVAHLSPPRTIDYHADHTGRGIDHDYLCKTCNPPPMKRSENDLWTRR